MLGRVPWVVGKVGTTLLLTTLEKNGSKKLKIIIGINDLSNGIHAPLGAIFSTL
jgi:hypothetical protein